MTILHFELLRVGHCRQNRRMACRADAWGMRDFPATVALLRHPRFGSILFDTGYATEFQLATQSWPERLYRLSTPMVLPPEQELLAQVAARGLSAADISTIVVSHFHADHVAGLRAFPHSRFMCAESGWREIDGIGRFAGIRKGLLPSLLPEEFASRSRFIDAMPRLALPPELLPFADGADLLGDGSLLAVDLPGHATGQFGVCCRIDGEQWLFLIADAAFSMLAIRENALPMRLAAHIIGHNRHYGVTLRRLHELHRRSPNVLIVPAHCDERAREFVR